MEQIQQLSFLSETQRQDERRQTLRLRERLLSDRSFEGFEDDEILSTVLSFCGTKDNASLISRLFEEFGSLKGVLEANPEQLMRVDGMSKTKTSLICLMIPMFRVWQRCTMQQPWRIGNSREAEAYCKSLLIGERVEHFFLIALNAQCKVLGKRLISTGSLSEVSAYPRICVSAAISLNAHSVLLCHNHPGGTCAPSPEDISSTLQLQKLLNGIGILLLDHVIVSGDNCYSLVQHGDIDYRIRR